MSQIYDVVIIGGGLNGTALALALGQAGLSVALIERLPPGVMADPAFDGRSYSLAQGSTNILGGLGIWDNIVDLAQPIEKIVVSDGHAGQGPSALSLAFDGAELESGPPGHLLEDRHLRRAIQAALEQTGVTQISGAAVANHVVAHAEAWAELDSGDRVRGRMIVGADGMGSPVAARSGISRMEWSYGQTSFSCAIEHTNPHHGVAHQFFMPPGPLAILPLRGNRASIVWTENERSAHRIASLDDEGYLALLKPRIGDFLGSFKLVGQRYAYPVPLSIARRFHASRVALIGDAAHRVHPIAGQGLNAGLKDVAALAEVVVDAARRGEDFGSRSVLARYEQWRRFDVASLALATDSVNRLFSNDNALIRFGRDLGMGLIGQLPTLRLAFMREAAGLTGDLPRLSRGLAI
ncbi:MAG: UbiH/UbiF/VisC/COQ6 family ubiquinone biosynthesis hydroxylase [Pseudomonadota bacterium]